MPEYILKPAMKSIACGGCKHRWKVGDLVAWCTDRKCMICESCVYDAGGINQASAKIEARDESRASNALAEAKQIIPDAPTIVPPGDESKQYLTADELRHIIACRLDDFKKEFERTLRYIEGKITACETTQAAFSKHLKTQDEAILKAAKDNVATMAANHKTLMRETAFRRSELQAIRDDLALVIEASGGIGVFKEIVNSTNQPISNVVHLKSSDSE